MHGRARAPGSTWLFRPWMIVSFIIANGLAGGAHAQLRDYSVVVGERGTQKVLGVTAINQKSCASVARTIILRAKPTKGQVKFSEGPVPFPPTAPNCSGVTAHQTVIEYTPGDGELGFDRFFVTVTGGPVPAEEREIVIYIRDPKTPNTAPPSRATVDDMLGPVKSIKNLIAEQTMREIEQRYLSGNSTASAATSPSTKQAARRSVQSLIIPVNSAGHFTATVSIGGIDLPALLDTGATMVTISRKDLAKLKIEVPPDAPQGSAITGNGTSRVHVITLLEMRVGPLVERAVPCIVLPPGVDAPMLIGMSFLNRMASVNIENGKMVLSK